MLISGDPKTVTPIYQTEQGLMEVRLSIKISLWSVSSRWDQRVPKLLQPFPTISNPWLEETHSAAGRVPTLVPDPGSGGRDGGKSHVGAAVTAST